MLALGWRLGLVAGGRLPPWGGLALLSGLPAVKAAADLRRHAAQPARLAPAIRATIAAAHILAVLLALALILDSLT